jgi:tRNA G10  N-methylase Trm11
MAKGNENKNKISFGKRKRGFAKKSFNKHNPKPKPYKGQGR